MKINILRRINLIVLATLALSPLCVAQSQVAGDWQGTLADRLHLILHIAASKDGSFTATLDSVARAPTAFPSPP
jgi:hypothetical protein